MKQFVAAGYQLYCYTQGALELAYTPPGFLVAERICATEDCIGIRANVVPASITGAAQIKDVEGCLKAAASEYVKQKRDALAGVVTDAIEMMLSTPNMKQQEPGAGEAQPAAGAASAQHEQNADEDRAAQMVAD